MRLPDRGDLRARRIAAGLQQRDVARAAGVDETLLRKWERGLELPTSGAAARLAAVLGTDAAALLAAQAVVVGTATPGEGYATAHAGSGQALGPRLPAPSDRRRVLDLFCGAGGLSYGFESSGHFATTCGIDLLPDRIDTFTTNHAYAKGVAGDLRAYSLDAFGDVAGPVDVVVGGPPCQGFSSIRPFRTLTEGDPRNSLAEHYVLVIAHLKPEWFVFENVVGILTHENGRRLSALLKGFAAAGYVADWRIMNAALYGIPQLRERVVVVGNRRGAHFRWPTPTHFVASRSMAGQRSEVIRVDPLFSPELPHAVTLAEAIGDLPPVEAGQEVAEYCSEPQTAYQRLMREGSPRLTLHRATKHSERMLEIIRHAGCNISALPPGMVSSGFSSCYSRLAAGSPSTTLTVNFVHPASNRCIHPTQDRALTPREGARIQSFPDRFLFRGTSVQVVKQIGNAVPPLLGRAIATAVAESEG